MIQREQGTFIVEDNAVQVAMIKFVNAYNSDLYKRAQKIYQTLISPGPWSWNERYKAVWYPKGHPSLWAQVGIDGANQIKYMLWEDGIPERQPRMPKEKRQLPKSEKVIKFVGTEIRFREGEIEWLVQEGHEAANFARNHLIGQAFFSLVEGPVTRWEREPEAYADWSAEIIGSSRSSAV